MMMMSPKAHLVTGVHEQSYLAHLAAFAGCLREEHLGCPVSGAARMGGGSMLLLMLLHSL